MKKIIVSSALLALLCVTSCSGEASLEDKRDGKKYKTVKVGEQVWMAENLNYDASGSKFLWKQTCQLSKIWQTL